MTPPTFCRRLAQPSLIQSRLNPCAHAPPPVPMPRPQGSIYLNDFARVVSSDHQAVNGILHFIDRVLLPPEALHWEPDAAPIPRVCPGHEPGSWEAGGWGLGPSLPT